MMSQALCPLKSNHLILQRFCANSRQTRGALVLALVGTLWGCPSSKTNNLISQPPQRSGGTLDACGAIMNYVDNQPSLSSDGTKVVYVTGRDSSLNPVDPNNPTACQATLALAMHTYKAAWPAGAAPGAPARATSADLGLENFARLSGDGKWIVIVGVKSGVASLYLQDASDASKAAVQIATDVRTNAAPRFSPDSLLLSWQTQDAASGALLISLVAIGGGTAAELAAATPITKASDDVLQYFWVPAASGYTLALATETTAGDPSHVNYGLRSFTTPAAAATATPAPWITNFQYSPGTTPAGSASVAVLIQHNKEKDNVLQAEIGTFVPSAPPAPPGGSTFVNSEPAIVATTGTPSPTIYATHLGFDLVAAQLSADGKTAFLLPRIYYFCTGDATASFGSAIMVVGTDSGATSGTDAARAPTYISPRLTSAAGAADTYEAATGLCDRTRPNQATARIDDKIFDLVINASGTKDTFRAAYVSRFATHFDGNCSLKTGDTEVRLLDVTPAAKNIYPLSSNEAALTDDPPNGAACAL